MKTEQQVIEELENWHWTRFQLPYDISYTEVICRCDGKIEAFQWVLDLDIE